jgi:hypothetical protein
MASSFGDVLAALRGYRNELNQQLQQEATQVLDTSTGLLSAFAARPNARAFATPLANVHATGVGVRLKDGVVQPGEFVLKAYVFDKLPGVASALTTQFGNIAVDVEAMPVQLALAAPQQAHRPIVGGVSIAPLNQPYVGTLGCFLRRVLNGNEQFFALSNNHVLAEVNQLAIGTPIVQPGPEIDHAFGPSDVFAALSAYVPLVFPTATLEPAVNRLDAAIALVADSKLLRPGQMLGVPQYTPKLAVALPGMRVIKAGRTTGVTTGTITATHVNGVRVNYSSTNTPRIATFNGAIQIVGDDAHPFSLPGDSGSVILEEATGYPVALLFAGDGRQTSACDMGDVCERFQAFPV